MTKIVLVALTFSVATLGAVGILPIPRASTKEFVAEGLFAGGERIAANLKEVRVGSHAGPGYERWVFDFGNLLPQFQVQYVHSGNDTAPRFILRFQRLGQNNLNEARAKRLASKSQFVKSVRLYPPIENGDTAMELILKNDVLFAAHQPADRAGRLVLDLRPKD